MKKKILCPLSLPPPFYGSNIVNKDIINSSILNKEFDLEVLPISYNKNTSNIGRFQIKKITLIIKYLTQIVRKSFKKHDLIYYAPAVTGLAFIRDLILLLPLKISRKNILIHLHGKGIQQQIEKNKYYKILYRFFFKNTSVICLSERLVYDLRDVFNGNIYIVNNGIGIENYRVNQKKNAIPVILYLSNLIEAKGILVLLQAANILKKNNLNFKLDLVGAPRGDIMDKINRLIEKYNLESNILSVGPKYDNDKKKALQNADIFVFPTFYSLETWGLVNIEAMQASLPVISTNEGAIPDIVDDGITGFLVKKKDPVDLAEKITTLLYDEELREKMGKKGREKFLNNYTYEILENRLCEVFKKVINNATTHSKAIER